MSFIKKLDDFLNDAQAQNIIDDQAKKNLQDYAREYIAKSNHLTFANLIAYFGGIAILLGLILIISHNWNEIPNFAKIISYSILLFAFHLAGYFLRETHERFSALLHFIGAGFVIAGIGLVAQIFHLNSDQGTAYLVWCIMILPLAVTLRHKWIGVMAVAAFYMWLLTNSVANYHGSEISTTIYVTTIAINLILLPMLVNTNECFRHLKYIGNLLLLILLVVMGFIHHESFDRDISYNLHPVLVVIFLLNIVALIYEFLFAEKNSDKFFQNKKVIILLLITMIAPFALGHISSILAAIIYWILGFAMAALMIEQGLKNHDRTLLNIGTRYMFLLIILRFTDLVAEMLVSGIMFIIFGVLLIGISYAAEKYRKQLINKISSNNVG